MRAAGSPSGEFEAGAFAAADCGQELLGRLRGIIRMLAGEQGPEESGGPGPGRRGGTGWRTSSGPGWRAGPGPGGRGGPWARRAGGPGGFGDWPGGPGGPWLGWLHGPPGSTRTRKASRGDVRAAILALLREGPRNGYQIMSDIEERSGGAWRPSPGAVYPALQQLADEGLVEAEESGGRRTFSLTEAGQRHIEQNPETARAAWESMTADGAEEMPGLFAQAAQLAGSVVQMAQVGTASQIRATEALLEQTRRQIYRILADGEGEQNDEQE